MSDRVRFLFDRIAPVYDRLNDWLSLGMHRVWKQMTLKWSEAGAGDVCLDLCCGSGDLALLLGRQVGARGHVYGIDFSRELLAIARQRIAHSYPQSPISWIEADALDLPFADNFFDAATMAYGLRNVANIPDCLQQLYRVLKPHAKAAILDFHRPSQMVMQVFQQWYLDNIVVSVAQNFGLTEEYAYITPSLERFPSGREQVILARDAGFITVKHYPIASGMMGVLVVQKPDLQTVNR